MTVKTTHFKVGNGDMTLVETDSGRKILVDCNICQADDYDDDRPDVAEQLRDRLDRENGKLVVDAFLLTHPDQDHCRGLRQHFHLGAPVEWSEDDDKILIKEMWSSPVIFRRASKKHKLCDDASAWASEARRRVNRHKAGYLASDGEFIVILGEDIDGKTDDLEEILVRIDESFSKICGEDDDSFSALLLAPMPPSDDDDEEETLSKNNSSVILNVTLSAGYKDDAARYLFGGDAEVAVWERVWGRNKDTTENLQYDVLIAPHHCSWHSLSWDSWSEHGEDSEVSEDARSALEQALAGATVISSSKAIEDDEDDPPCIRAKREYDDIVAGVDGEFTCLADLSGPDPLVLKVTSGGPRPEDRAKPKSFAKPAIIGAAGAAAGSSTALGSQPFEHG